MLNNFTEIKKFQIRRISSLYAFACESYEDINYDEIDIMDLSPDVLMGLKDVLIEYMDKFEEHPAVGLKVTQIKPPYNKYYFTYHGWDYPKNKFSIPGAIEKTWGKLDIQKACDEINQLIRLNTKMIGDYTIKDIENLYEKSCKYVDEYCRQIDGHIPTELESFFVETNQLLRAVLIKDIK